MLEELPCGPVAWVTEGGSGIDRCPEIGIDCRKQLLSCKQSIMFGYLVKPSHIGKHFNISLASNRAVWKSNKLDIGTVQALNSQTIYCRLNMELVFVRFLNTRLNTQPKHEKTQ